MKLFGLLLGLLASQQVLAIDAVVGIGTPASCTTASYNAAIALVVNDNQGGTLTFNCGPNPHVIAVPSTALANFVAIDGGGKITLDGQDLNRIFSVNQDGAEGRTEVFLRNIDLNRGNARAEPFGGAILVNANTALNLDRVSVRNSLASLSGGGIATFSNVVLTITNSQFISNQAANGGAIATRATVTVDRGNFVNNVASGGEGGAIQSYDQMLTISNSSFRGNGARFGGAVYKRDLRVRISDSDFVANSSNGDGGALYVLAGATEPQIANSYFYDNVTTGSGGGIYSGSGLSLQFSTLGRNLARSGGGVAIENSAANFFATTLHDNRAELSGGGMLINALTAGDFPILFQFLTTSNNTVSAVAGFGGDIAITSSAPTTAQLYRSTLMNGSAAVAGSIDVRGQLTFVLARSLIWSRRGSACAVSASAVMVSALNNVGPVGCNLNVSDDVLASAYSQFRLSSFGDYGGGHSSFLPLPGSPAIDRVNDTFFNIDARRQPSPIDGDGNGSVLTDAGAVERQQFEDVIFRDGLD